MSHYSLPVNAPLSPPPYEEAIRTTGPEIPVAVETEGNDEPPPSYNEATKDDVFPSEPPSTSDLTELIIASIVSAERPRQGRQPLLSQQLQSSQPRSADGRESQEVEARRFQIRSHHRKKLSLCLLGAGMAVFLVTGLIAASILRHRPKASDQTVKFVTALPHGPSIKDIWMNTQSPSFDRLNEVNKLSGGHKKLLEAIRKAMQLDNSDRSAFLSFSEVNEDNSPGRILPTTIDPFYEEIRKLHINVPTKTTSAEEPDAAPRD